MRDNKHVSVLKQKKVALAITIALGVMSAQTAYAVGESTIQGSVTGVAASGADVIATNVNTGQTVRTQVNAKGDYTLLGLSPGSYKIKVKGRDFEQQTEEITVQVGESSHLDIAVDKSKPAKSTAAGSASDPNVITIKGSGRKGVRNSEVGTSISTRQIESLPQNSRNFLAFADLAPGVRFVQDAGGNTRIQSGAASSNSINVFVDGVSQKNDVLTGGVSGQDSTRGNPFPQTAVGEYKVITQNYKAEYDKVSSAAVIAATKSGTNEFHGEVFFDVTNGTMKAKSPYEKKLEEDGIFRPQFVQKQYGASIGGPIVKDKAHFFLAYEHKDIGEPRQIALQNIDSLLPSSTLTELKKLEGTASKSFKEDLFFGKVDLQIADNQKADLSFKYRTESDILAEDNKFSTARNHKTRDNDETRVDLKHEYQGNTFLNEARAGYEKSYWSPHSALNEPFVKYRTNDANGNKDIIFDGGTRDGQNKGQKGWYLQDDFTYTGIDKHKIKAGVKYKDITYDLNQLTGSVPEVIIHVNPDGSTYINPSEGKPTEPPGTLKFSNKQVGLYLQDDWRVNKNLEINAGVRWDYETNAMNNSYVTPQHVIDALNAPDTRNINGITAATPGQTYADSLALGGLNVKDFISTGSSRKPFKGAFQPRVGFSYDLNADQNTVFFGGWGRAYDRTIADRAIDEAVHNKVGGEIWLMKNKLKVPSSDQWTLGVRQKVGDWNAELGYINSVSKNGFVWFSGNRAPDGSAGIKKIDPLWGGPSGYGNLILGDTAQKTKTNGVYLKAEKPFTKASGWGASLTYNYSRGRTTAPSWDSRDIFSWVQFAGKEATNLHPSIEVETHRFVGTGTVALPYGITLSGKLTLGSGLPYRITDCTQGWDYCYYRKGKASLFRQFDLSVQKEFKLPYQMKLILRADVLNLFNTRNYGYQDGWTGPSVVPPQNSAGGDNKNFGKPGNDLAGPARTLKLGLNLKF